ncbi:MAG: hypothetical protein RIN63_14320 [Tissierella sp.]|nr:hypothetical protein [Tissierella sp.]
MLQRKIDRAMDWLKDKNTLNQPNVEDPTDDNFDLENFDPKADWLKNESENMILEKNDFFAIAISALLVFSPIFIILGFIIFLML